MYAPIQTPKRLCTAPPAQHNITPLVRFAFALRLEIAYVDGKFVLLIAAQIRIAHVVERVLVVARTRRDKVQLHLCLLLQREPFDGQERVRFWITDNDPPAFLAFLLRGE